VKSPLNILKGNSGFGFLVNDCDNSVPSHRAMHRGVGGFVSDVECNRFETAGEL